MENNKVEKYLSKYPLVYEIRIDRSFDDKIKYEISDSSDVLERYKK